MATTPLARIHNSFSGVDIKLVLGETTLAEVQGVSYAISRERAPIYGLGNANVRAYAAGKRAIAGSLITAVYDRSSILGAFGAFAEKPLGVYLNAEERNMISTLVGAGAPTTLGQGLDVAAEAIQQQRNETQLAASDDLLKNFALAGALYTDQLPPLDITMVAANQVGAAAVMRILQCVLSNSAYGVSIDDVVSEEQHQFFAGAVVAWQSITQADVANAVGKPLPRQA